MTDHDPLASIEALLNDLRMSDSRYSTIRDLDLDHRLRAALTEAREAVDALSHRHDDQCESEYETGAHAWTPCGCWASRSEAEGLLRRAEEAEAALGRVGGEPLEMGDGYFIRESKILVGRNQELDFDIEISLGYDTDTGRLAAGELTVRAHDESPSGVTSEVLREIPVSALIRYAKIVVFHRDEDGKVAPAWPDPSDLDEAVERGNRDELLRLVARVYRVAYLISAPPTKQVEIAFRWSRSTAGRWIAEARKRGYLGATTPGKAGA